MSCQLAPLFTEYSKVTTPTACAFQVIVVFKPEKNCSPPLGDNKSNKALGI